MPPTVDQFLDALRSELGYYECSDSSCPNPARETAGNHTKFAAEAGHANGQPWCATGLVAVAKRTGLKLRSYSAYTPTLAQGFQSANDYRWSGVTPTVGAWVFFSFGGKRIDHVAAIEEIRADSNLVTLECNTSTSNQRDGGYVMRRVRDRRAVVGFGRPRYAESASSGGVVGVTVTGTKREINDMQQLVPKYHSDKTDDKGRAVLTIPVPIDRVVGSPKSHSEVNVNRVGYYDPVANSVTCTPSELNGGPATDFVIQGDDPNGVYHLWWHELEDVA